MVAVIIEGAPREAGILGFGAEVPALDRMAAVVVLLGGSFVGYIQGRIAMWLYGEPHPGGFDEATSLLVTVVLLIAIITGRLLAVYGIGARRVALMR